MALPVAHAAVAIGISGTRDRLVMALVSLLAVLPDSDFILVWGLGWRIQDCHRTFTHSLGFALLVAALWSAVPWLRRSPISPWTCFLVLFSHAVLDSLCTLDAVDHGVVFFWPLSDVRVGWPVLVPLYSYFAPSPFSPGGALRFTLLELMLALPLWTLARSFRSSRFQLPGSGKPSFETPNLEP